MPLFEELIIKSEKVKRALKELYYAAKRSEPVFPSYSDRRDFLNLSKVKKGYKHEWVQGALILSILDTLDLYNSPLIRRIVGNIRELDDNRYLSTLQLANSAISIMGGIKVKNAIANQKSKGENNIPVNFSDEYPGIEPEIVNRLCWQSATLNGLDYLLSKSNYSVLSGLNNLLVFEEIPFKKRRGFNCYHKRSVLEKASLISFSLQKILEQRCESKF